MGVVMLVLHQFEFSHFNEKARWALDYKGVAHERKSYLPGPHMPAIRKLSGQQQTPVLTIDGEVVAGSANIIDALEERYPEKPLYPVDSELRQQALALQSRFDEQVGPAARSALFSGLIQTPGYLVKMFARRASTPKRLLYRASLPLAKRMIAKGNSVVDKQDIARAFARFEEALEEVADMSRGTGFLVGESFSVADLTAAALLAPFANPDHPDMSRPQPVPAEVADIMARYSEHPALHWVRAIYRDHRPA